MEIKSGDEKMEFKSDDESDHDFKIQMSDDDSDTALNIKRSHDDSDTAHNLEREIEYARAPSEDESTSDLEGPMIYAVTSALEDEEDYEEDQKNTRAHDPTKNGS